MLQEDVDFTPLDVFNTTLSEWADSALDAGWLVAALGASLDVGGGEWVVVALCERPNAVVRAHKRVQPTALCVRIALRSIRQRGGGKGRPVNGYQHQCGLYMFECPL